MSGVNQVKDTRVRNYATMVYPESVAENWLQILSDEHVPVFVSPLHDKDVSIETGEVKKPHHHVVIMFKNKKSEQQVKDIFDKIHAVGIIKIQDLQSYSRYLIHMDNPEKAQYSQEDVICLSGADYNQIISLPRDKYKAIREMQQFCMENKIVCFAELADYAAENRFDWFKVLCDSGSVFIDRYLKSKAWVWQNPQFSRKERPDDNSK